MTTIKTLTIAAMAALAMVSCNSTNFNRGFTDK